MRSYDEYKETKYDWLPLVPKYWAEKTIRTITSVSDKRNGNRDDLELLSVYRDYGVIKKSSRDDNHNVESQDLSNYKQVSVGNLVMNKMKMWQGSLGVSMYNGIVSPAYIVCDVDRKIYGKYLHYLLRSAQFKTFYNRISYGVRVGQWDLRYDDFKSLKIYLPSDSEQKQIVRYLDSKTAKINKLVQLKKKEVELLKEYRQAVITKAVTKGIHEGVKMKDSGVEWIGEIPEDWSVLPIKYYTKCNMRVLCEKTDADQPIKYIDISSVTSNGKIENIQELTFGKSPSRARRIVFENDIIISTVRTYLKAIAFISTQYSNYIVSTGFAVLTPDTNVCYPPYLYYALHIDGFINQIQRHSIGISYPSISSELLISFKNIIPSILEQKAITNYLDKKCSSIDKLISEKQSVIEKLSEYKTRLISDAVTGKIDVSGINIDDVLDGELNIPTDEDIDNEIEVSIIENNNERDF